MRKRFSLWDQKTEFKELQEFTEFKNGREEAIGSSAYHWKGAA
jgi:hypothetical protein